MALPKRDTIPRGGASPRIRKRVRYDIVVALFLIVLVAMLYSILHPTMHLVKQHDAAQLPAKKYDMAKPVETVDSELLEHEQQFLSTIKSCIPSENPKCKEYIPENNGNAQRIALISPPGKMSEMLWHWVEKVVKQHHKTLVENNPNPIEFILTSHVPPYGYGKTHGLTKIIRLVPKPLVMGVADAIQHILVDEERHHHKPGEKLLHQEDITLEDLKSVTRQFLRYHCRLSHVAAHTSLLSINLNDFIDNYEYATEKLHTFLKLSKAPQNNANQEEDEALEEMRAGRGIDMGMEEVSLLTSELGFVSKILTRIQADHHVKVLEELDKVLLDEMQQTKNLTAWPCSSFWMVGEPPEKAKLSPIAVKVAESFSPNCTDPFNDCWVKRDLCEAKGDGPCKDEKKNKK